MKNVANLYGTVAVCAGCVESIGLLGERRDDQENTILIIFAGMLALSMFSTFKVIVPWFKI